MTRGVTIGVGLVLFFWGGLAGCDPAETTAATDPAVKEMPARVVRRRAATATPSSSEESRVHRDLRRQVELIRTQIELYRLVNRHDPWPATGSDPYSWSWYLRTDDPAFRPQPPRNPLADDAVASRVVAISTHGATGARVDPATAGWVWNTSDEQFFAAGIDESPSRRGRGSSSVTMP